MTDANNLDLWLDILLNLILEEVKDCFCLDLDGPGRSFLNEDVTILTVFEGEEDEINSFSKRHNDSVIVTGLPLRI